MDLLKRFAQVCKKNGLKYYAIHGTLLGCIRHQGFIPWDDDIDVAMPRNDYDKLLQIAAKEFTDNIVLQHPGNDFSSFFGGYAKLRNMDTAAVFKDKRLQTGVPGIWIDIFPLDLVYKDEKKRKRHFQKLRLLQLMKYCRSYHFNRFPLDQFSGKQLLGMYLLSRLCRHEKWQKILDRCFKEVKDSDLCGIIACYYKKQENRNIYEKEWFKKAEDKLFADTLVPVPCGYDQILKKRYGDDYMQLPERHYRHSYVKFDTRHSIWQREEYEY